MYKRSQYIVEPAKTTACDDMSTKPEGSFKRRFSHQTLDETHLGSEDG